MKKLIALVSLLFSVIVPIQAHAADQKALVIIDSYFDSRVSSPTVSCVVLATNSSCTDIVKKIPKSLSDNVNHGNAMVEVAKKQNAGINIIALRSGASPSSDVNAGNFIDALTWVNNNSNKVSAVSLSRYFNGTKACSPASVNTAPYGGVVLADKKIVELIDVLKSKGIPVFVSTGNAPKKKVDYPACLTNTNSVTSPGNISDINTDFSVDLQRVNGSNFVSNSLGLIALTTSSATAAVAANWVILGGFSNGTIQIFA